MPIPAALAELVRDPIFWARFFFDPRAGEPYYPRLARCVVSFPLAVGKPRLDLTLDPYLGCIALRIREHALGAPLSLGWDDQSHPCPHVLRWPELEAIARASTALDPTLGALPLLLLCRFAPICDEDDVDSIVALLAEAWATVGLTRMQARRYIERIDHRDADYRWVQGETGRYVLERGSQDPPPTLRFTDGDFPHRIFARYVEVAEGVVRRAEPKPTRVMPPFVLRPLHRVRLEFPRMSLATEIKFRRALDEALAVDDIGTADWINASYSVETREMERAALLLRVRGDLERGLSILSEVVRANDAPPARIEITPAEDRFRV